jgi:hypothetical protein
VYGAAGGLNPRRTQQFTQRLAGSTPEAGDQFGGAFATGDFDRDGYSDLAVGSPGEDQGSATGAGHVSVIYGTTAGLSSARVRQFSQGEAGGGDETGDRFGAALTSGDFDGDGYTDLAVGSPGEDNGSGADVGYASVIYGGASGLSSTRARGFTQSAAGGVSEGGDRFGSALAAGRVDGDAHADLVAGAPDEDVGSAVDAGQISIVYGTATGLGSARTKQFTQGDAGGGDESGDRFGAALAVGRLDGDDFSDVAIGSPDEDNGSGADVGYASVLYGAAAGPSSARAQGFTQSSAGGVSEAGDRFGAALTLGRLDADSHAELVVGAPDENVGSAADAGQVSVLFGTHAGLRLSRTQQLTQGQAGGGEETGDRFGAALAFGHFDSDPYGDLAIGSPDEDNGSGTDVGYASVVHGAAGGLVGSTAVGLTQSAAGGVNEAGDRFGAAVR